MGTVTVSMSDDVEERFRTAVKSRMGEGKGKLGKAVEAAINKWVEEDDYKKLMEEAIAMMKKGLYKLPKNYKFRREEAYEERVRKITGSG